MIVGKNVWVSKITEFNKRIPKQKFYKNLFITPVLNVHLFIR